MPPTLHLVRHAEGFHNSAKNGESIHDPFLTEKGEQQARELCSQFQYHDDIDLLMASPMKRTIQTCQFAFDPVVKRGHKILLMPQAQESSLEPMDTGSTKPELEQTFGDLIDTPRLELFPYWNRNIGRFDGNASSLIERATALRAVLRSRPEKNIVLVSHGTFAHFILGNIDLAGEQKTRMWSNAECRSYKFVSDDDEEAQLVELESSKSNRPDLEKQGTGYVLSTKGERKNSAGDVLDVAVKAAT
ncbi:putative histidine phosphatase superfamily, clade-1 [Septoria linicola]|nr:putative histidine phosphatase superfamily, clade-1 [Septoria linicola]